MSLPQVQNESGIGKMSLSNEDGWGILNNFLSSFILLSELGKVVLDFSLSLSLTYEDMSCLKEENLLLSNR